MPEDSIVRKTLLGGHNYGLGFFGAIRTAVIPLQVANPNLRETRGENFLHAVLFTSAFALYGMAAVYKYYTDRNPHSFRRQLEEADWWFKGIFVGVTSALVIFGMMQAAQATLLYFATGLSTNSRNDLIQLVAVMSLVGLLGSIFAANYYRRQEQPQHLSATQTFNPGEGVETYHYAL